MPSPCVSGGHGDCSGGAVCWRESTGDGRYGCSSAASSQVWGKGSSGTGSEAEAMTPNLRSGSTKTTRNGRGPNRNKTLRYGQLSVAALELFIDRHFATKKHFAEWVGVSSECLQKWIRNGSIPRTIEIIVTNEKPSARTRSLDVALELRDNEPLFVPKSRKIAQYR